MKRLAAKADMLAVTASRGYRAQALRRLSYELEGSGVDLLVAPALTNVTGTRIRIWPVAGLPLLHLDEPVLPACRQLAVTGGGQSQYPPPTAASPRQAPAVRASSISRAAGAARRAGGLC